MRSVAAFIAVLSLVAGGSSGAAASSELPTLESPRATEAGAQQITVSVTVAPIRVLVVDDVGRLRQVWSNCDGPAPLAARAGSVGGREVALTAELLAEHERIATTLAPGARGLVYDAGE